ncbi:MAG TPA: hypothetical protein VGH57_06265, partial [Amycolatopsis sp.]
GIALFSRCLGANATFFAMQRAPNEFADVRCLVACQPASPRALLERRLAALGIPAGQMTELDRLIRRRTGFSLDEMSPVGPAGSVRVPTFVYQVRDDLMTRPSDVQAVFDAIPADVPKELSWIHGTTRRWDGYRHFQLYPGRILDWLARHWG